MRIDIEKWRLRKNKSYLRIWEDLEIGYLDRDLLPLLTLINRDADLYTTSSCSGRIVILDGEYPWIRDESHVVFKTHVPAQKDDILEIYQRQPFRRLWIIVNGPILHVYSRSIQKAIKIIQMSRRCGFKHSGILGARRDRGVFIELISGIYMSHLLRTRDQVITSSEYIETLLDIYNKSLVEGKRRLSELYVELAKILPETHDEQVVADLERRGVTYHKTPYDVFLELVAEKQGKYI